MRVTLQQRTADELEEEGDGDGEEGANQHRADEDEDEERRRLEHGYESDALLDEVEQSAVHDDGHRVVQHGFAEDERVEVDVDPELLKDGQDGDGVGGADERAEYEGVKEGEAGAYADDAA